MSPHREISSEAALCARFEEAMGRINTDQHLIWRGRTLTADCLVQIGSTPFLLQIDHGRIAHCTRKLPLLCSTQFTLKGTAAAWSALWEAFPPAGWHDLFALIKRGEMTLEGNMQQVLAHLQYIKDVLAAPGNGQRHA